MAESAEPPKQEQPPAPQPGSERKELLAGIVTIGALGAFALAAVYLLVDVEASELTWSRRVYVFAAIEAISFAAVGWLFGREVNRARAENAEGRAANAEQKADAEKDVRVEQTVEARDVKNRAQLLKQEIESARQAQGARRPPPHLGQDLAASEYVQQTRGQLDDLAAKAERLFPE